MTKRFGPDQINNAISYYDQVPDEQLPFDVVSGAANRLFDQVNIDALTGTYNANAFGGALNEMVTHTPLGYKVRVAKFDLDNFKALNDGIGHDEADGLLRQTAEIMSADYNRGSDVIAHGSRHGALPVGRLSGDEFAAAYYVPIEEDPHISGRRQASKVPEMPLVTPEEPLPIDQQTARFIDDWRQSLEGTDYSRYGVGITAGIADFVPGDDARTLLSKADGALVFNKYAGKVQGIVDRAEAEEDLTNLIITQRTLQDSGLRVPDVLPAAIQQVATKIDRYLPPDLMNR